MIPTNRRCSDFMRDLETSIRKTVNLISMFCKSSRYKCVFKHVRRGIFVIVLGMRVVLGWLRLRMDLLCICLMNKLIVLMYRN